MSTYKHIDKICCVILAFTLLVTILFMNGEALGIQNAETVMGYEETLFDTSRVHSIDIVMEDWDSFVEGCSDEEYVTCTVDNGSRFLSCLVYCKNAYFTGFLGNQSFCLVS